MTAAAAFQIEMARQHLSQGIDINAKDSVFFGLTPLSIAAGAGQSKMVKFLLQQGMDVNARNDGGGMALHGASFLGRSKSAQLLIENEGDIKARASNGATARDLLKTDWASTQFISQSLQLRADRSAVEKGRAQVAKLLGQ